MRGCVGAWVRACMGLRGCVGGRACMGLRGTAVRTVYTTPYTTYTTLWIFLRHRVITCSVSFLRLLLLMPRKRSSSFASLHLRLLVLLVARVPWSSKHR